MVTIATLFSGGEGVGVGAKMAGFEHIWGIEYVDEIAKVARDNGFDTLTKSILDCDPKDFEKPDLLHASPPCPNFSIAKKGAKETEHDIAIANKACEFIRVLQPRWVTIENVMGYRKSESYAMIIKTLNECGYYVDIQVLNFADYGVPQTRKRLIVRASKDGFPPALPPKQKWVGWYDAIEDLIPTLPESKLADWQIKRLPKEIKDSFSWVNGNTNTGGKGFRYKDEPSTTVSVQRTENAVGFNKTDLEKGFIVSASNTLEIRSRQQPELKQVADERNARQRAFIIDGKPLNYKGDLSVTDSCDAVTVGTASQEKHNFRAFIVGSDSHPGEVAISDRNGDEPSVTTTVASNKQKAFILDSAGFNDEFGKVPVKREQEEPTNTILSNLERRKLNGYINGKVVSMTPRALARFQSFPDWYKLPEKKSLACRIIGNAVSPLMYYKIAKAFLEPNQQERMM